MREKLEWKLVPSFSGGLTEERETPKERGQTGDWSGSTAPGREEGTAEKAKG